EARKHRSQLRKVQREILAVQKQIAANKKKESSQLFVLNNLDLDIDLTQSVLQDLRKETQEKERQIAKIDENLNTAQQKVARLKEALKRRLIHFYKHGRIKDIELLLTARSLNQGLLWLEYQKRLANHDHRNFKAIIAKEKQIQQDMELRLIELENHKVLLAETLAKEHGLKKKKQDRRAVLVSIRKDIEVQRQQVAAKRRAARELSQLIAQLQEAPSDAPLLRPDTPIAELRGRMMWPAQGKIFRKFGKQRHPQLKTVTENLGVDIRAPRGSDIFVVASGRVTQIRWMRGHGTVVIVRHYGGYLTVYSHFEEVLVAEGEEVEMGQVIGTVGESASLDGPILHFEIWKGKQKLNPESWLGRAT
ncbi:peptidoglycan DD-metalloendopeptidase family protein, partial [bacterium]|nr:peptidoglycan DD-metalloendopeptidase family protein [bacterium]